MKNYYVLYIDKLKVELDNFIIPQLTSNQGYVSYGGVSHYIGKTYYFPEFISFTIHMCDYEVLNYIKNWHDKIDIILEVFDDKGKIIESKTFFGCFPISFEHKIEDKSFYGTLDVKLSFDFIEGNIKDKQKIEEVADDFIIVI